MRESAIVIPQATLHRLSELSDLLARASVIAREISRSSKPVLQETISENQDWFWTPEWQAAEREVDDQLARGEYEEFDSMEEAIAYLHKQV